VTHLSLIAAKGDEVQLTRLLEVLQGPRHSMSVLPKCCLICDR